MARPWTIAATGCFAAVAGLGLLVSLMAGIPAQEPRERDLGMYEKRGTYDLPFDAKNRAQIEATIRESMWNAWNSRRLGHLIVRTQSKEGEPSKNSFFFEMDDAGNWCVSVIIERQLSNMLPSSKRSQTAKFQAYSIERVKPRTSGLDEYVKIGSSETVAAKSYRLLLKDAKGEVHQEW